MMQLPAQGGQQPFMPMMQQFPFPRANPGKKDDSDDSDDGPKNKKGKQGRRKKKKSPPPANPFPQIMQIPMPMPQKREQSDPTQERFNQAMQQLIMSGFGGQNPGVSIAILWFQL